MQILNHGSQDAPATATMNATPAAKPAVPTAPAPAPAAPAGSPVKAVASVASAGATLTSPRLGSCARLLTQRSRDLRTRPSPHAAYPRLAPR
jgi:hypothetical protein